MLTTRITSNRHRTRLLQKSVDRAARSIRDGSITTVGAVRPLLLPGYCSLAKPGPEAIWGSVPGLLRCFVFFLSRCFVFYRCLDIAACEAHFGSCIELNGFFFRIRFAFFLGITVHVLEPFSIQWSHKMGQFWKSFTLKYLWTPFVLEHIFWGHWRFLNLLKCCYHYHFHHHYHHHYHLEASYWTSCKQKQQRWARKHNCAAVNFAIYIFFGIYQTTRSE